MDRAGKAAASVGTGVGIGGGESGGVLLGAGGRDGLRSATREELFVSYLSMMHITCDNPDCVLISFLSLFCQ